MSIGTKIGEGLNAFSLLALVLLVPHAARAQSVEQFYKGKTITLLVGLAPGGVYDISSRLVSRHLPRFIPGQPTIIVQNLPAAGGLTIANRLATSTAERDGTVLAVLERSVPQLAIQGDVHATFDPQKFTWLGSISSYADDAYLLLVNAKHPANSVDDLKKPGMRAVLGGGNAGSSNGHFAAIAKNVLGLNIDVVRGYPGAAPIFLAMQRGEVDGQVIGFASLKTGQRGLWDRKEVRPLLQFGRMTRLSELPDVPTGRELAPDEDARALIEFAELPFFMAMPFLAPPEVPEDRAQALRSAFMAMSKDQTFVADARKLGLEISPIDSDAITKLLSRAAATPKQVIEHYKALTGPQN
jgi:tripartite-type tricarboxylate transporter receptor subunit TctC